MAKVKAPKVEAPDQETPAPDLSALRKSIVADLQTYFESEDSANGAILDGVIKIREAREENPNIERESVRTLIQEAVAEIRGLKIEFVQNAPAVTLKKSKPEDFAKRNSAYVLVSTLMSMSWPKREDEDKKVKKALDDGERRFTVIKKLSVKPSNKTQGGAGKSITKENFTEKLKQFLVKAQTDMGEKNLEEILDLAELEAIPAIRAEIDANPNDDKEGK